MAQVRWYLNNSLLDGWQLVDQTAAAAATCNCGWVVGTGSTFSSELQSNTERASTTFVANTVPDGTLDTSLKDALRSQFPQTGSFAAGTWDFQFAVVSTVQSGAADGQIVFRILKANFDGSSATEITSAQQATTIATNVAGTDINITASVSLGAWTITNQYLFVQLAWKRTGAGGMTTTNIRLRTGSSSTVGTTGLTADFTPLILLPAAIASTAVLNVPTVTFPPQAVTNVFLASTLALFAATITPPIAQLTLPFLASTLVVNLPSVSGGSSSTTVTDNFDRANDTTLGANWTNTQNGMKIGSNWARPTLDSVYSFARYTGVTWTNDHTSEATLMSAADMELTVRHQANGDCYMLMVHPSVVRIYAFVGGSFTQLVDFGVAQVFGHAYRLEPSGGSPTSLKAFDNGTQLGSTITDSTSGLQSGGAPGIGGAHTSGAWNDWIGTGATGGGGPSTQTVTTSAIAATTTLSVPTVVQPGVDQAVTGVHRASTTVLTAPAVYPFQSLVTSLIGHWPMSEASGSALDAHGTNPLALTGTEQGQDPIDNVPARGFEAGVPNYFTHGDNTALNVAGNQPWTLAIRLKFESASALAALFLKMQSTVSAVGAWGVYWSPANGFVGWVTGAGGGEIVKPLTTPAHTSPVLGATYLVAAGFDFANGVAWVRINQDTRITLPVAFTTADAMDSVIVGGLYATGNVPPIQWNFDGAMGPISFWKRVLTDAELDYWGGVKGDYAKIGGAASDQAVTTTAIASTTVLNVPRVNRVRDLTLNMVGHWPFSETGLDTADALDQRGSNSLTALGGTGAAAQDPMNGIPARYVELDNLMAFRHADNADLSPEPGAGAGFTFIIRCKFETNPAPSFLYLFAKDNDTGSTFDIYLYYQGGSGFRFRATNEAGSPTTTAGTLQPSVTPGQTYFVAGRYDPLAGSAELSIRWGTNPGDMQGVFTAISSVRDTGTKFTIGGRTSGTGGVTESFDGAIGPATWFKRALTNAEIDHWVEVNGDYAAIGGGGNAQTITTGTIAATVLSPPTVTAEGGLAGAFIASTLITTAPTVTAGPVAVTIGTSASTLQVFAPTVAAGPVAVTTGTRAAVAVVSAPTVTVGPVAVTTGTITSTSQVFAPTVVVGPVAVTTGTIASGNQRFAPTVAPGPVTVVGGTLASTIQVFAPTLTVGPVAVTTPTPIAATQLFLPAVTQIGAGDVGTQHIPTTAQLFAPTVTTGPVTVVGGTRTTTIQLFAPSVAFEVLLPHRATTAQLFAATVANTRLVTTGTIATGNTRFAPTVAPGAVPVTTGTLASPLQLFAPSVTTGATTVVGGTVASTLQTFLPIVTATGIAVTTVVIASTAQLYPPTFIARLDGAFIPSTTLLFAPTVSPPTQAVSAATRSQATQEFAPALAYSVTLGTRAAALQLFAPSVAVGPVTILAPHRASTTVLSAPLVGVGATTILTVHRPSTLQLFPPSLTTLAFVLAPHRATTRVLYPPGVVAPTLQTILMGVWPKTTLLYSPHVWTPIVLTKDCAVAFPIETDVPPSARRTRRLRSPNG